MSDRVEIQLENGHKLVAMRNTWDPDFHGELCIGIEDSEGVWIQDLVCVQDIKLFSHCDPDGTVNEKDDIRILVWGNALQEDYTDEYGVPICPQ